MYARILYATLLLIFRTLAFPYFLVRNFVMLRKHRSTYKKLDYDGIKRFTEDSPELAEGRSRLVQDSFARSVGSYFDSSAS